MVSMTKGEFEKVSVYKAEIVNNNLALQTKYFTEVPDVKDLFLNNISYKNNSGFEMTMNLFGESMMPQTGSLGMIYFYINRTWSISNGEIQNSYFKGSDENFTITEITDSEIKASGEVTIFWDGPERKEQVNLILAYKVVCNNDGTLTFSISGKDDVTKAELGATESNSNPSYELRSAGASILKAVTE